jgi:DNA topoisomerase-1
MPHQLIICEKPSAAQKIATALAGGRARMRRVNGVPTWWLEREGREVVVASAIGHLYTVDQDVPGRGFPVFSVGWYPVPEVEKKRRRDLAWIGAISSLAKDADSFVSACDYDTEGSLIAYMLLKHACNGAEGRAMRMKFSTLTRGDLEAAYRGMAPRLDFEVAEAGKTRHELDWIFGINVSRALTDSLSSSGGLFEVLSAGRVQSPTLNLLYRRELAIKLHIPDPFWAISAEGEFRGKGFPVYYKEEKFEKRAGAEAVAERCNGTMGMVASAQLKELVIPPPFPFDLGTLQREAYRHFRLSPSRTQKVAESLYLDALISYPRTSSQKLPPSLGLDGILRRLGENPAYSDAVWGIFGQGKAPRPREGGKSDPAHPAIHPSGKMPEGRQTREERQVYDLIVRRFLATFGEPAIRARTEATIRCGESDDFFADGEVTKGEGWMPLYPFARMKETPVPKFRVGDGVLMKRVAVEDRFTQPPARLTPTKLLGIMERNSLGTKATRADIMDTLYRRGYIEGGYVEVTDLGMSVIRVLRKFFPELTRVEMTRDLGRDMELIRDGAKSGEAVLGEAVGALKPIFERVITNYDEIGEELSEVLAYLREKNRTLGQCPACAGGSLVVIYSRRTGKRFVGCTNYSSGCRFSRPLPQRGKVKPTGKKCGACGLPVVEIRGLRRKPWRICIDDRCPSKK